MRTKLMTEHLKEKDRKAITELSMAALDHGKLDPVKGDHKFAETVTNSNNRVNQAEARLERLIAKLRKKIKKLRKS